MANKINNTITIKAVFIPLLQQGFSGVFFLQQFIINPSFTFLKD